MPDQLVNDLCGPKLLTRLKNICYLIMSECRLTFQLSIILLPLEKSIT